jgi:hypothetical protein
MGYDVHIVRTRDWTEAKKKPIRRTDVEELVRSDSELSFSKDSYGTVRDPETGKDITAYAIVWNKEPYFFWDCIEITCKNPPQGVVRKMVSMANRMRAFAVGDDGERYELRHTLFGVKVVTTQ